MNKSVGIVDYGIGNILSVKRAFEAIGVTANICTNHSEILSADRLVLPGVGAFGAGIAEMHKRDLFRSVQEYALLKRPLLGICLGAQMLLGSSEENLDIQGLSLISGKTVRIPTLGSDGLTLRIPIVGWYPVQWKNSSNERPDYFYFVHSFHAVTNSKEYTSGIIRYGGHEITAVVQKDHILGYQFHPEKSGQVGLNLLKKFIQL